MVLSRFIEPMSYELDRDEGTMPLSFTNPAFFVEELLNGAANVAALTVPT